MRFPSFSLVATIVCIGSVAAAQQYLVTPNANNHETERRIYQLERAVQELQTKVYNLQTAQATQKVEVTNPKRFFCKVNAFNKTYQAFGATDVEARAKTMTDCRKDYAEMHCAEIECRKGE